MNSMKSKVFGGLLVLAGLVAMYWYWSPLLTLQQMQTAAKTKDAEAFSEHVDYPRLRQSLKDQLSQAFTLKVTENLPEPDSDLGKAGAALGASLGKAMLGVMVDNLVHPSTIMAAMQGEEPQSTQASASVPPKPDGIEWHAEHQGGDKYLVHVSDKNEPNGQPVTLVLERSGFADWKLTGLRIPALLETDPSDD
jgi:hypothetical protein